MKCIHSFMDRFLVLRLYVFVSVFSVSYLFFFNFITCFSPFTRAIVCVLFSGSGQLKIIITKSGDTRLGKTITPKRVFNRYERKKKNRSTTHEKRKKKHEMTEELRMPSVCSLIVVLFASLNSSLLCCSKKLETHKYAYVEHTHADGHSRRLN